MASDTTQVAQPYDHRALSRGKHSLPRHQILHFLRGKIESKHRFWTHRYATDIMRIYQPLTDQPDHVLEMTTEEAIRFCNKTAPLYLHQDGSKDTFLLFLHVLHNWLYRKWFQPYRSEIECGQFIVKTIYPKNIPHGISPTSLLETVIRTNQRICTRVEALPPNPSELGPCLCLHDENSNALEVPFHLNPLFRAVVVVIDVKDYHEDMDDDLGRLPVYLALTGIETGLSAPINFTTITDNTAAADNYFTVPVDGKDCMAVRTTLETAFTFLSDLERRETSVFGLRPDANKVIKGRLWYEWSVDHIWRESEARRLGWEGDFALDSRSSQWVDSDLYPTWSGVAAGEDQGYIKVLEDRQRRTVARIREQQI